MTLITYFHQHVYNNLYSTFSCSVSDEMLQQLEAWRKEAADVPMSQKLSSRGQSDSGIINPLLELPKFIIIVILCKMTL